MSEDEIYQYDNGDGDPVEVAMPLNAMDATFIIMHDRMERAIAAGFSRDEAFEIVRGMVQSEWQQTMFERQSSEHDVHRYDDDDDD